MAAEEAEGDSYRGGQSWEGMGTDTEVHRGEMEADIEEDRGRDTETRRQWWGERRGAAKPQNEKASDEKRRCRDLEATHR